MSTITTKDGTEIFYKDWSAGPVITFSHGWPLSSDAWDGQMMFLVQHGYPASRTTDGVTAVQARLQPTTT